MPVDKEVCVRVARANNSLWHQGAWLHHCSWPPLPLACVAYRFFAHAFQLQRQTGQTSQPGYILHLLPLQIADTQKSTFLKQCVHQKCNQITESNLPMLFPGQKYPIVKHMTWDCTLPRIVLQFNKGILAKGHPTSVAYIHCVPKNTHLFISLQFSQTLIGFHNIWHTVYWGKLQHSSHSFTHFTCILLLHYLGKIWIVQ